MKELEFDVAIVGAGAAGITSSIFASRFQLGNVVYGMQWGGEIANAHLIENYPGFTSITGAELSAKMLDHARHFGADIKVGKITDIKKQGSRFVLTSDDGGVVRSKAVILAMGLKRRHLNVTGEEEFAGKGVSYCATCDAAFFKEKITAVVGGGDAALTAALHLAELSPQVYMIVRGKDFRGEPIWQQQVVNNPKIKVLYETQVAEVIGDSTVSSLVLTRAFEGSTDLKVSGLFVEAGADPDSTLPHFLGVVTDEKGYIKVDEDMKTNVEGVFAAGDITTADSHFDQIISAEAQGGLAARSAFYLLQK